MTQAAKPNPLFEIVITIIVPAVVLMKLSGEANLGPLSALLLALAGCTQAGEPVGKSERLNISSIGYGVFRFIDHEAGVVCWVYKGSEKGGISCLPLGETRLDVGEARR